MAFYRIGTTENGKGIYRDTVESINVTDLHFYFVNQYSQDGITEVSQLLLCIVQTEHYLHKLKDTELAAYFYLGKRYLTDYLTQRNKGYSKKKSIEYAEGRFDKHVERYNKKNSQS